MNVISTAEPPAPNGERALGSRALSLPEPGTPFGVSVRGGDCTAKWIDSESATIRPEGVLSEVYAPEATREELAAAVGQVLDILSDDEEEDE